MHLGRRSPALADERSMPGASSPGAGTAAAATVIATCVVAGLAIAMAVVVGRFDQSRNLNVAVFVVGFGVLLPAGALLATLLSGSTRDRKGLRTAALVAATATVALIAAMRLAGIAGLPDRMTAALGIAGGTALAALAAALPRLLAPADGGRSTAADRLTASAGDAPLAALAAVELAVLVLAFAPTEVSAAALALAVVAAIGVAALLGRREVRSTALPGWAPPVLDAALLLLVTLAVIDISGYWNQGQVVPFGPIPSGALAASVQFHQHFYLGAVNDVLHGRALLVDANSVYGIGNAYLIALWFKVAPIGYGTFGLFGNLASLTVLVTGWAIARAAGVPRLVAAITIVVAVLLTILSPPISPGLFSNVGGLRFGPPFILLAAAVYAAGRGTRVARSPWVLATFALFTLWSVETVTYCAFTYLALLAVDALALRTLRAAASEVGRGLFRLIGAILVAHLLFAVLTRLIAGGWPDWEGYLALFKAWSDIIATVFGGVAEPWSRAWLVGGLYVASGIGVVALLRMPEARRPPSRMIVAIAGMTATGISFLSYFVAHAGDLFLPYITYPALIVVALWLSLAIDGRWTAPSWRGAALAMGTFLAIVVVAGSWTAAREQAPRSLLAHLLPGGRPLRADLDRTWHSPPIDPRSVPAVELIDRYFPADEALVLTDPDLGEEALLRSGRANLLPISYPWQDEVYLDHSLPVVADAVDELKAGTPILLQEKPRPDEPLTAEQAFGSVPVGERLGPLSGAALELIRERFDLERVATGPDGLYVAELAPRGP